MFTKLFRRPRCAMPITTVSTPNKNTIHEYYCFLFYLTFNVTFMILRGKKGEIENKLEWNLCFLRPGDSCYCCVTVRVKPKIRLVIVRYHLPCSADVSIHSIVAGMNDSHPSRPNLFSVPYFFARKFSKLTALIIFIQIHFRCSAGNSQAPGTSNLSLSQSNWWKTWPICVL